MTEHSFFFKGAKGTFEIFKLIIDFSSAVLIRPLTAGATRALLSYLIRHI